MLYSAIACVVTPLASGGGAILALALWCDVSGHELDRARTTSGQGLLPYTILGSAWPLASLFNKLREGSVIEIKPAVPVPVDTA